MGLGCCERSALCDRCLADALAHLRGVAACRGEAWSTSVAARVATRQPWPAFDGRPRELAFSKTADLSRDSRLHELLAKTCHEWAVRTWSTLLERAQRDAVPITTLGRRLAVRRKPTETPRSKAGVAHDRRAKRTR